MVWLRRLGRTACAVTRQGSIVRPTGPYLNRLRGCKGGSFNRTISTLSSSSDPDFYARYLAYKVKFLKPHEVTRMWLRQLGRSKAADPCTKQSDPLEKLQDLNADIDAAIASLETYVGGKHAGSETKPELQESYLDGRVGMQALYWYLESKATERFDAILYPKFFRLLAHCMVGEQAEDHLWSLLRAKGDTISRGNPHDLLWKGNLLRSMVEANTYWASDEESFTQGVRCLRQGLVDGRRAGAVASDAIYIPAHRAGGYLESFYSRIHSCYVTIPAFEVYVNTVKAWDTSPFSRAFRLSRAYLRHPSRPDGIPALRLLESISTSQTRSSEVSSIFGQRDERAGPMLFYHYIITAQVLEAQGLKEQAYWGLDFARSEMPESFVPVQETPYRGRSSPFAWKRKPTSREVAKGVPVDDKGYVVSDERHLQYREASEAADIRLANPFQRRTGVNGEGAYRKNRPMKRKRK